jgi:RimJ/RimL family protein N-acetyltransferase
MSYPGPAYRIKTARLVLRCWHPADAPLLSAAIIESREHLLPWMPWAANEPLELSQRVKVLRRFRGEFDLDQDFIYGVFNPDETRVLGGSGLHTRAGEAAREIGYWIHSDFTHQGLATELTAALTRVAFEVEQVNRVEIHCDPRNAYSAAVPRKLGYTLEGTLEGTLRARTVGSDGKPRDSMVWTLLRDEYPASPNASAQVEAYNAIDQRLL